MRMFTRHLLKYGVILLKWFCLGSIGIEKQWFRERVICRTCISQTPRIALLLQKNQLPSDIRCWRQRELNVNCFQWGMPEKRALIARTVYKPNYALQGTYDTHVNRLSVCQKFLFNSTRNDMTVKGTFTSSFRLHLPLVRKQRYFSLMV